MILISPEDQQILDALKNAVAEALERKRRLGQYAVVWRDGRSVILGEESPTKFRRQPHLDIAGKGQTIGDLVAPLVDENDWECLKVRKSP
ncbi:MAG TPA: hypothetical protein P5102_01695 [Candidatus Competibacteraceae bacterium]|nr:hypothetical protein [Candidatus Competibacteraceae bacterium]HRZ04858.1 hypothetical protein [Candidatus Competibacteraceae bacterium]HSA46750.1 hypothetical protein [Candidatus Competibacteraceae bacterium]